MGVLARILRICWARWADYNSFVAILDLFDCKTGFFGLISTVAMIFIGATNPAWSPQGIVLAALVAGACVSLIVIAFRIFALGRPVAIIGDQANSHGVVASPATAPILQNITLRNEQKKQLIKSVIALKPDIKSIMINRSSSTTNNLWIEFAEVFNRAGFGDVDGGGVQTGFQESTTPNETGVMICINDPNSPSKIEARMKDALARIRQMTR
jgi:hypothetical protein